MTRFSGKTFSIQIRSSICASVLTTRNPCEVLTNFPLKMKVSANEGQFLQAPPRAYPGVLSSVIPKFL